MHGQPIPAGFSATTPRPILSAAQQDAVATAAVAIVAVQRARTTLASRGRRLQPVSSSIFGQPVYDRDPGVPEQATTPTIVPYGHSVVRPIVSQGSGPVIGMGRRVAVGGKVPIGRHYTGATVFGGPRVFAGRYGSSIFGGGISGLGATDSKGYELAPCNPESPYYAKCLSGAGSGRCGFLGKMMNWDASWPCNNKTADAALQAQIAWWKSNPANQAADTASMQKPIGLEPWAKGAWITGMCSGMVPVPPGLSQPAVCTSPPVPPYKAIDFSSRVPVAPPPTPMQPPPSGGAAALVPPPTPPVILPPPSRPAGTTDDKKMMLILGGLAVVAVAALVLSSTKKPAAAAPAT